MTQKFEMADRFNPSAVEQALYQHWEESGYFKPSENENAPSYCIAIPPPNVTGSLHMGHGRSDLQQKLRFGRGCGKLVLPVELQVSGQASDVR